MGESQDHCVLHSVSWILAFGCHLQIIRSVAKGKCIPGELRVAVKDSDWKRDVEGAFA